MNPLGAVLIILGVAAALIPVVMGVVHQHHDDSRRRRDGSTDRLATNAGDARPVVSTRELITA